MLFLTRESKTHIFMPRCNLLFIILINRGRFTYRKSRCISQEFDPKFLIHSLGVGLYNEHQLLNQNHPKVTSGRMMGTELTLINPFVKFVRNVRKLRNFHRIPDGTAE